MPTRSAVTQALAVGRRATGTAHPRLLEHVRPDLFHAHDAGNELAGYDACFLCLGASSLGRSEADYTRTTYDLTVAAATALARLNPGMTFIHVSGQGTDSSEAGRVMWARVKGRTENALLRLPFRAAYMFRPVMIQPVDGARSDTAWLRAIYVVLAPVIPALRRAFPDHIVTTAEVGRAMLRVARDGHPRSVLEIRDIAERARTER